MADRIFVLADGKVEAAGSHEELVSRPGLYSELFELQAAGYRVASIYRSLYLGATSGGTAMGKNLVVVL
jgi:hypothetical protein